MNDERFLKDWLRDTPDSSTDPNAVADQVVARLPHNPQRHRWLPGPPASRPKSDHPDRRTRLMLSPVQAVTGGVIALALSVAFVTANPLEGEPAAPSAEAPPMPNVVEVTGTSAPGGCPRSPETEVAEGGGYRAMGRSCNPVWNFSDPRLNGKATNWRNTHVYPGDDRVVVESFSIMFENDEGAWRLRPQTLLGTGGVTAHPWPSVWVLDGEGAYDGFTAVLNVEDYTPHGYIIEGELPPVPEIASTTQ